MPSPPPEDRLRQHPHERFAVPVHAFDLFETARRLREERAVSAHGHRQETLYKHDKASIALFTFEAGAGLAPHTASGTVTIHVIEGRMRISADGAQHERAAGQILVLAPGVEHDVAAIEDSTMLLHVHLE